MLLAQFWFSVGIVGKMADDLTSVYVFKTLKTNVNMNCVQGSEPVPRSKHSASWLYKPVS